MVKHNNTLRTVLMFATIFVTTESAAQPGFTTVMTANFEVKYQRGLDEVDARRIADYLQSEYEFLTQKFGVVLDQRIEVRIYSSVGKYLEQTGQQNPWRAALLHRSILHMQPVQELIKRREFEKFLTYEVALAVFAPVGERGCPRWLREAAAVYHAGLMADLRPPTGMQVASFTDLDQDLQTYAAPPRRDDVLFLLGETFRFFIEMYGEENVFGLFRAMDGTQTYENVIGASFGTGFNEIEKAWASHITTKIEPMKKGK